MKVYLNDYAAQIITGKAVSDSQGDKKPRRLRWAGQVARIEELGELSKF